MRVEARFPAIAMAVYISSPLFAAAAWGQATQPAASAPSDEPQPATPKVFALRVADLYTGIESEYEQRRVKLSPSGERDSLFKSRDFRLYELVGTTLTGHVYDPNLVEYKAALEFGLSQTSFRQDDNGVSQDDSQSNGFLHEYDISVDALKTKPVSFNAYARRSDNRLPRAFLPSLHELQTESGVSSLITAGPTTTEIGLSWQDVQQRGNREELDDENLENSRFYIDHTWTISDSQKLHLQYDYNREESKYQGSRYHFDARRSEFRLDHELAFGSSKQHLLDTFFRYDADEGDLGFDEMEFTPRLTLTHNDKLKTIYRYSLYRFSQGVLDITQNKLDVQAVYRPKDDLRFTLDTFGLYEGAEQDVDTTEYGVGLDMNYNRPTSLGNLNVNLATAYQQTEVHGDAGRRYVRSEAHALGGVRPVFLKERGVIPTSVVARDERQTRYYVPGVDYVLIEFGQHVQVNRIVTGRIEENQVVYFDYEYIVPAHAVLNEYRNSVLLEHTFKFGLTPYYSLESQCEDVESSTATPWKTEDSYRHRLGTRYDRTQWSAGTEYEFFDNPFDPYDAWHVTGRTAVLRSAEHALDLAGELSRYWFTGDEDERDVWWLDLNLKDRTRVTETLSLMNGLAYRWEDDTKDGTTHGVDWECGFQYVRGALSIELTVEYDLLSIVDNQDGGLGVYLNVRRNLTHLLQDREGQQ
jgi:hypothetical protein